MHKHIKEIKQMTAMLEKGYPIEGMVRGRELSNHNWYYSKDCIPEFIDGWEWQSALARVEDKYAHLGDIVYHKKYGDKREVVPGLFDFETEDKWSWSPKPPIVMVPLLRKDAEWLAGNSFLSTDYRRVGDACKEALK